MATICSAGPVMLSSVPLTVLGTDAQVVSKKGASLEQKCA